MVTGVVPNECRGEVTSAPAGEVLNRIAIRGWSSWDSAVEVSPSSGSAALAAVAALVVDPVLAGRADGGVGASSSAGGADGATAADGRGPAAATVGGAVFEGGGFGAAADAVAGVSGGTVAGGWTAAGAAATGGVGDADRPASTPLDEAEIELEAAVADAVAGGVGVVVFTAVGVGGLPLAAPGIRPDASPSGDPAALGATLVVGEMGATSGAGPPAGGPADGCASAGCGDGGAVGGRGSGCAATPSLVLVPSAAARVVEPTSRCSLDDPENAPTARTSAAIPAAANPAARASLRRLFWPSSDETRAVISAAACGECGSVATGTP
jgi:hypothetical protein